MKAFKPPTPQNSPRGRPWAPPGVLHRPRRCVEMEGLNLGNLRKWLGEQWRAKARLVVDVIDEDTKTAVNQILYRLVDGQYDIKRRNGKIIVKGDKVKAVMVPNGRIVKINVSGRLEDVLQFIAQLNEGELKDVFNIGVSIVNVVDFVARVDNKYVRSLLRQGV